MDAEAAQRDGGSTRLRVLIAGGGTGGHVIPALAIARELRDTRGAEVQFVGTARGLESKLVPEAGFQLHLVRSGQLKNVGLTTRAKTALDVPRGVAECVRLIREFRPQVVVGVGGYASGPGMIAAIMLRVPTLAFEPNAVPGLANRLVGKSVSAAAVNFEQTCRYFRNAKVTGIPVRPEFFSIPPGREDGPKNPRLLVFGGSQGARVFNVVMPKIARQLLEDVPELTVLHQCGARAGEATEAAYAASGADPKRWTVREFLDDMPRYFADADLMLCRSGASTVAELAAAGRPALLVPFPGAADDHQLKNAEVFQRAGAAALRVQEPDELMSSLLLSDLSSLLHDSGRRAQMAAKARALARPDALRDIAEMVASVAKR